LIGEASALHRVCFLFSDAFAEPFNLELSSGLCCPRFHLSHTNVSQTFLAARRKKRKTTP
jgi:hypothetical protein